MVHLERPDEALDLMKLAKSGSGEEALPRTRAMLHTIEAWAQASMGRGQAMRRTLGEAEELFVSDKGDVPPPSWMQIFDEADLHGMQALAYRTLAEHEPGAAVVAQHHAKEALRLRVGGLERSQIFDHISMASACFIDDEPEKGDRYAQPGPGHHRRDVLTAHLGPTARYVPAHRPVREPGADQEPAGGDPGGPAAPRRRRTGTQRHRLTARRHDHHSLTRPSSRRSTRARTR